MHHSQSIFGKLCTRYKKEGIFYLPSQFSKRIKGIKSVYKTHKENGNLEKVTVPELKKIANVVFMDILKTNKKFIAKLKKRGKTTEDPTDTGTIFKKSITSF